MYDIIFVSMPHATVMQKDLFYKCYIIIFSPLTLCEVNLEGLT